MWFETGKIDVCVGPSEDKMLRRYEIVLGKADDSRIFVEQQVECFFSSLLDLNNFISQNYSLFYVLYVIYVPTNIFISTETSSVHLSALCVTFISN